jgi:hypothetical protein
VAGKACLRGRRGAAVKDTVGVVEQIGDGGAYGQGEGRLRESLVMQFDSIIFDSLPSP